MKKFLAVLLVAVLTMSCLAGCSNNTKQPETSPSQKGTSAEPGTADQGTEEPGTEAGKAPITTDPITISIFSVMSSTDADIKNLWYYKYLEYWMREQGYNVTIEVSSSEEPTQQKTLGLATDTLADLYIGPSLTNSEAVLYGSEDGIVLDWTPYLNEQNMPNTWALLQEHKDALTASTCLDGGVYGLPYISDRNQYEGAGDYIGGVLYVNKNWMEKCKLEIPTTMDGFIDMLRAFKNVKLDNGQEVIPLISCPSGNRIETFTWSCLGYYGGSIAKHGSNFLIKNKEVYIPAYTDDYDKYVQVMRTLYEEGLISKDHYTMDNTTARGLIVSGVCGAAGDSTLMSIAGSTDGHDWVALPPLTVGDEKTEIYASATAAYKTNYVWASASTKYPEVVAYLVDYMYSPEGRAYYFYGPAQGKDPLNLVDGWYLNADGQIVTKLVEDGTYKSTEVWAQHFIYSYLTGIPRVGVVQATYDLAGIDKKVDSYQKIDDITGESVTIYKTGAYSLDNANGWGRHTVMEAWTGHQTFVRLPSVYMNEADSLRATELSSLITNHITAETAKFVTGVRPLSELKAFKEELKALGIEEYIEMHREAYAPYLDSVFK